MSPRSESIAVDLLALYVRREETGCFTCLIRSEVCRVPVSWTPALVPGYAASFEKVQNYLAAFPGVHIYKGLFPATSGPITNKRFSFVHLDADLYEPTRDSLEFFYPRVNSGGMFLIHDYLWAEGVRAVQEFFASCPETILELAGAYCGVVKL